MQIDEVVERGLCGRGLVKPLLVPVMGGNNLVKILHCIQMSLSTCIPANGELHFEMSSDKLLFSEMRNESTLSFGDL